jgi:hypothetical protein
VVVDRPTVIGFFPPARHSADAEADGYAEGVSHIQFALEDAAACLGRDSSRAVLIVDSVVRVRLGARIDTLRFARELPMSYGAYLIAPGREPYLVPHGEGSSTLIPAVRRAIPTYFRRAPCAGS